MMVGWFSAHVRSRLCEDLIRLLTAIFCLIPFAALADYPDPKRKQTQVDIFSNTQLRQPGSVVVTGSSSILRWRSINDDLAPSRIILSGIPTSNMNDLDYYLHDLVLRFRPSAVVIYQGDNDMTIDGISVEQIIGKFDNIVKRMTAVLPDVPIYVMSVKPSIARWSKWSMATEINRQFSARADEQEGLTYVDVATPLLDDEGMPRVEFFEEDKVHLNEQGYRVWTSILQPLLAARP